MEDFRRERTGPATHAEIYQVVGASRVRLEKTLQNAIEMMGEWSWEKRDDGRMYCEIEMSSPFDEVAVEIKMVVPGRPE